MEVLWRRGAATVAEVAEALPQSPALAYNTVLTTLRILERKGYVRHRRARSGRAFVYRPSVPRQQATSSAVRLLLQRFFDGSRAALALNLLEEERIDKAELDRIRALIARADDASAQTEEP